MTQQTNNSRLLEVTDLKTWFPIKRGIFARTVGYIRAVDGVSFYVNKGETLGLVGESGCGKTTLGRTLLRLEEVREGEVAFDGQRLSDLTKRQIRELRQKMQIIFQDPLSSLNPRMNVLDIITEGLLEFKLLEGKREDHAVRLMLEVGLDAEAIYRYPHEFSGGQRQRINIARAISLRPDFIVCDEPVSALDVSVQAQVINLLMDLRDSYQLSYLFISHDISVVSYIADRTAVMYRGKLVEEGPTFDIINYPKHPYTKALIAAVPVPGIDKSEKLVLTEGERLHSAAQPGCSFQSLCPEVKDICRREAPQEKRADTRRIRCHLYSKDK
jgi:oligopeptide/dipeptide ABC transporter ATP-binding protein